MIEVVVADDHKLVRQMFATTFSCEDDLEMVGEAATGAGAITVSKELDPDVLVLDMNLPEMTGVQVIRELRRSMPELKILVLTAVEDEGPLFESLAAGAQGYLLKDSDVEEVLTAIRDLHEGRGHLHPRSTMCLLNEFQRTVTDSRTPEPVVTDARLQSLSPRELEILEWVGHGFTNPEIAEGLYISEKTVKTHVSNILRRLEVSNRIAAATFAVRNGLCRGGQPHDRP